MPLAYRARARGVGGLTLRVQVRAELAPLPGVDFARAIVGPNPGLLGIKPGEIALGGLTLTAGIGEGGINPPIRWTSEFSPVASIPRIVLSNRNRSRGEERRA